MGCILEVALLLVRTLELDDAVKNKPKSQTQPRTVWQSHLYLVHVKKYIDLKDLGRNMKGKVVQKTGFSQWSTQGKKLDYFAKVNIKTREAGKQSQTPRRDLL